MQFPLAAVRPDTAYGRRTGIADYLYSMGHETVVDSCGDGRLWNARVSQAVANETLSRAFFECSRIMICGAGAAGLEPHRFLSGYAEKDGSACEVITAAHTSLGCRGATACWNSTRVWTKPCFSLAVRKGHALHAKKV